MAMTKVTKRDKEVMLEQLDAEQKFITKSSLIESREKFEKALATGKYHDEQLEYGQLLIRSPNTEDRELGIRLLRELLETEEKGSFTHTEICLFLAKGYWWNKDYLEARNVMDRFIVENPIDHTGHVFFDIINEKINSDAYVGYALTGATVAAVGLLAFGIAKALHR
jgi:hypothetical protein